MKLVVMLLFLTTIVSAQAPGTIARRDNRYCPVFKEPFQLKHNALGVFTNHTNWGLGIAYSYRTHNGGFYARVSGGDFSIYNVDGLDTERKASAGILLGEWLIPPEIDWHPFLAIGLSYNEYTFLPGEEDPETRATLPFDVEVGLEVPINRINVIMSTGLIKWQFMFGLSYLFNLL